jgi:hypothetical protein
LRVFVQLKGQVATFSVPKILNLYTPADEFEERVSPSFVRKIQTKLQVTTVQCSFLNKMKWPGGGTAETIE